MVKRVLREPAFSLGLIKGLKRNIYPLDQGWVYLCGYGRYALLEGLKVLRIKEGSNVLVPKLICNVVLAPFHQRKINVRYYDIKENLEPVWETIYSQVDPNTRAVLGVNYFGFPCGNDHLRELCDERNLFYIEDNAHGFLSRNGEKPLGSYGNISLWSFRKTLPIPDGGGVLVNNPVLNEVDVKFEAAARIFPTIKFFAKMFLKSSNNAPGVCPSPADVVQEFQLEGWDVPCSWLSRFVLNRLGEETVIDQRKKMYQQWLDIFSRKKDFSMQILFNELKDGVVPWAFPVLAESPADFMKHMWAKEVEAFPWPYFPKDLEVPAWMKKIVCLPVYPYISITT